MPDEQEVGVFKLIEIGNGNQHTKIETFEPSVIGLTAKTEDLITEKIGAMEEENLKIE